MRATVLIWIVLLVTLVVAGCGGPPADSQGVIDSTPTKLDGSASQEFERDDIQRAGEAPQSVQDYCAGAASEAQRVGCESHVTEDQVP